MMMAYESMPAEIRNDRELLAEFPPKELAESVMDKWSGVQPRRSLPIATCFAALRNTMRSWGAAERAGAP
jgi:hypothetical protein